jgi:hypothetical protein
VGGNADASSDSNGGVIITEGKGKGKGKGKAAKATKRLRNDDLEDDHPPAQRIKDALGNARPLDPSANLWVDQEVVAEAAMDLSRMLKRGALSDIAPHIHQVIKLLRASLADVRILDE